MFKKKSVGLSDTMSVYLVGSVKTELRTIPRHFYMQRAGTPSKYSEVPRMATIREQKPAAANLCFSKAWFE